MSKTRRSKWFICVILAVFIFGPAVLFKPSVKYKTIEKTYDWGSISFKNSALGKFSSPDILHQVDVIISPHLVNGKNCEAKGAEFAINSSGKSLPWSKAIVEEIDSVGPFQPKNPPKLRFTSHANSGAIPLTLTGQFDLFEGCMKPGTYGFNESLKPSKQYYWLGHVLREALMSV